MRGGRMHPASRNYFESLMEEEEFLVNTGLESMNFIASFAVW